MGPVRLWGGAGVCAVGGRGARGGPGSAPDPRRAEPNGFWVTLYRYPSIVLWADLPECRTSELVQRLGPWCLDGMRDLDLTPQRGRAGRYSFRWIRTHYPHHLIFRFELSDVMIV